jgi:hypothetical protein
MKYLSITAGAATLLLLGGVLFQLSRIDVDLRTQTGVMLSPAGTIRLVPVQPDNSQQPAAPPAGQDQE